MNLYEVIVSQTTRLTVHIEAESLHDATEQALAGHGRIKDAEPLPPSAKPPTRLGREAVRDYEQC